MEQKMSSPRSRPVIRMAETGDLGAVLDLVHELADYEKAPDKVTATLETYVDGFENGYFHALVAELGNEIIGTAIYYKTFSTWKGRMMYLEDFIVRKAHRRLGVGKLLFQAFLEKARDAGAVLCKWQVLQWNEPAIDFYRQYNPVFDDEWVDVKLYF